MEPLATEEIFDLLNSFNQSNETHTDYIRNPNNGEVYMFYKENGPKDYKVDNFKWNNMGSKFLPESTKLLKITYHTAIPGNPVPKGSIPFKKRVCKLVKNNKVIELPVLIQYIGDQDYYKPGPHGNAKRNKVPFERSKPSTLDAIKKALIDKNPSDVYKNSSQELKPRNLKQCQNIKAVSL